MGNHKQVAQRRQKVAELLVKSVTSVPDIAKELGVSQKKIEHDIAWLRKKAEPWLDGLAFGGFIHDTKIAIDQFLDIERELQTMREKYQNENDPGSIITRLKLLRELREAIETRIELEANGPTLMALKRLQKLKQVT